MTVSLNAKKWLCILTVMFNLMPALVMAERAKLTHIHFEPTENGVRVSFSLTQPTVYHILELANPNRLAIDFDQAQLATQMHDLGWGIGLVTGMRSGWPTPGVLRIVLDLNAQAGYRVMSNPRDSRFEMLIFAARIKNAGKVIRPTPIPTKAVAVSDMHPIIVVIDAGHGGKDPGAIGRMGTKEKDVVLAISLRLADLINHQTNMRAVLTRKGDYFVPLRNRLNLARKGKADLFVAIHADSYFNKHSSGASIYALSQRGATSEAARWLAKRDNYSELGGVDLSELGDKSYLLRSVLIDLAQTATITDSLRLGTAMLDSLDRLTRLHYSRVEQAPFVVLKSPDIPSVLVETGFISNSTEEQRLRSSQYQDKIAQALFNGIRLYLKKYASIGV